MMTKRKKVAAVRVLGREDKHVFIFRIVRSGIKKEKRKISKKSHQILKIH